MHDWQSADVIDLLTTQMMTDLYEWRHDRGRALRGADDSADLRRAIVFAGQKLDAFQMARFLEDSRLWPADQQLVLKLQYAAKERARIVAKLNEPPAPERIEGATEVAIGVVFWEKAMEYMVTAGPDHNGNWTVEHIATKQVYANIDTGLIQRRLDEARNAAQALQSQPNVQARPANWPQTGGTTAPLVTVAAGLRYKDYIGNSWTVTAPSTRRTGQWVIERRDTGYTDRMSERDIQERYRDNGTW